MAKPTFPQLLNVAAATHTEAARTGHALQTLADVVSLDNLEMLAAAARRLGPDAANKKIKLAKAFL